MRSTGEVILKPTHWYYALLSVAQRLGVLGGN